MSGRKKSEVVDLLSTGSEIRANVLKNKINSIEKSNAENNTLLNEIKKLKAEVNICLTNVDKEVDKKYFQELNLLLEQVEKINLWSANIKLNSLEEQINSLKKVKEAFKEIDLHAERLREVIKYKPHYCDEEYRDASKLVQRARKCQNEVSQIEKEISEIVRKNYQIIEKGKSLKEVKKDIVSQYNNLKERSQADNNKEQIIKEFQNISREWAEKLLKKEYNSLENEIQLLTVKGSASEINNQAQDMFDKITKVRNKVISKKEEYELKKQQAEREFREIKEKLAGIKYDDLEQNMMNGTDEQIGLFEFEKNYSRISTEETYNKLIKQVQEEIKNENFDKSFGTLEKLRETLEDASHKATLQYEKLLKEQDIMGKIAAAAYELGYDVSVKCLNEDIRDGYTVEAIAGDEIVNFDRISVDENGNTIINLDHHESKSTCGNSMKNFIKALRDQGIFITDIKGEDGRSVIYSERTVTKETNNKNISQTKN